MTKILILIFTVLLALNINASDTKPDEVSTITGDPHIISGKILVELPTRYDTSNKFSVIDTEVYFKTIQRTPGELGIHINYDDLTLELFYHKEHNTANVTLTQQGLELHVVDDILKKQLNTVISHLRSNLHKYLHKSFTQIESFLTKHSF